MNPAGIPRSFSPSPADTPAKYALGLTGLAAIAVILARGIILSQTPLSFDEAYYWLWSKHLAAGYLDHPPLIAFLIRAGTMVFGDTSAGVRIVPWILSAAASWAVWRCAEKLGRSSAAGAFAALLFNLMPMIGVESGVATPDSPEIAAAAFMLLYLINVADTGYGPWWLAVGTAAGVALLAKYTAFFLGAGILLWLLAVPEQRRWFVTIWPWLGAGIALVMFTPVVLWNAQHDWVSFALQFGRTGAGAFTLRYVGEFAGGQLFLASPIIAVLGGFGAIVAWRYPAAAWRLLPCMMLPAVLYFAWHSLHDRVQGNWPSFLYPALAISCLAAFLSPSHSRLLAIARRLAVPVAAAILLCIYGLALIGAVPGVRDPVSRLLGYDMDRVAAVVDGLRAREHAAAIVTTNYALTGWLSFYLPGHTPVVQLNERLRYLDQNTPDPNLFQKPLIYVSQTRNEMSGFLASRFADIVPLAHITRARNGVALDQFAVYRLDKPKTAVLTPEGF